MGDKYVLDEQGEAVPCNDLMEWARWFENAEGRRVANDHVGDVRVSTVFLGLDHSFGGAVPILWETMIFGGEHDGYQERYSSRRDAVAGHARALALIATPPTVGQADSAAAAHDPQDASGPR